MADINVLRAPFDNIKTREGAGGKSFSYVAGGDVLNRIIEVTDGAYDWEILDIRLIEGQNKANKRTGEVYTTPPVWMVHGRLSIPGMGAKDGIGTATAETEDSPKSAETDALKRAACKFGVALELYRAEENQAAAGRNGRQAAGGVGPINDSGAQCPKCNCPPGKAHVRPCI